MRRPNLVRPSDPNLYIASIFAQAVASVSNLHGFEFATRFPPEDIPDRFIRYEIVGAGEASRVGDRPAMRVQVWQDGPEADRFKTAGILLAFLRARGARLVAGPITMPDPIDAFRSLAQFEVELLLIGKRVETIT